MAAEKGLEVPDVVDSGNIPEFISTDGWQIAFLGLFLCHSLRIRLLLLSGERWIFDNRGVILTLIIHWLEPSVFLPLVI